MGDAAEFKSFLQEFFSVEQSKQIFELYDATSDHEFALTQSNSDVCLTCPTFAIADTAAGAMVDVSVYYFEYNPLNKNRAIHGSEIPFVFGNEMDVEGYPFDEAMSAQMMETWVSIGKGTASLPSWDKDKKTLVISDPTKIQTHPQAEKCKFWESVDVALRHSYCNGAPPPSVLI